MYAELVPYLRCPACAATPLTLLGPIKEGDEIVAGALRCSTCDHQSPIINGVWDALGDARTSRTPAQLTNYLPVTPPAYEPAWRRFALSLMSGRRFPLREELRLLHDLIRPEPGNVYVDVACSAGLYARAVAHPGAIVAGIDHSWAFVRHARTLALDRGLRISYIRATAQNLPFDNGVAAGTMMGGSLNEIGDQRTALQEIRRIMRSDARFFCMSLLAAHSRRGGRLQQLLSTGGIVFPSPARVAQWRYEAGLEPIARWRWGVVAITLLRTRRA